LSLYLAVAGMPVNVFMILGLGATVGVLSGLFGVGGGFLLTPLLMTYGIPPAVAAASDSNQIVAASCSGALAHKRLGNVDVKMGLTFLAGSILGGTAGTQLVRVLRGFGNYDVVVKIVYVLLLAAIGGFMFWESLQALRGKTKNVQGKGFFARLVGRLPWQVYFPVSGVRVSVLFVVGLGFLVGALAALLGVGGGFITVPAMIYLLRMPTIVAIGTDLFQIVFTSMNVTFQQAITNHTVDVVLAVLLFCGSTVGAQVGARLSRLFRGEQLRIILAVIVLLVMLKLFVDLVSAPADLITLTTGGGGH